MTKIAIVRVRGSIQVTQKIKDTLDMLRLHRKNYCTVIEDTPSNLGMIKKAKDFITWGPIDDATYKSLVEKRGEEYKDRVQDSKGKIKYKKFIEVDGKKMKPMFRLNPPTKGFGRKGIKVSFKAKGALGDRKEKINDLIQRMI